MTWGRVFWIDICWIGGTILLYTVISLIDKLLRFIDHKGWNDLSNLFLCIFFTMFPPICFTFGFLCYSVAGHGIWWLILMFLLIVAVILVIPYIVIETRIMKTVKKYRDRLEGVKGHRQRTASACCMEQADAIGYEAFHKRFIKEWGRSEKSDCSEYRIRCHYIFCMVNILMGKFGGFYRKVPEKVKKDYIDRIIRYQHDRFPVTAMSSGKDAVAENAEQITGWEIKRTEYNNRPVFYIYIDFMDGFTGVIRFSIKNNGWNYVSKSMQDEYNYALACR